MAKVKLSKDGSIDFAKTESIPTSVKKFKRSPEIEGFYRFVYENLIQREAFEILNSLFLKRKKEEAEIKKVLRAEKRAARKKEKDALKTTAKKKKTKKK